MILNRSIQYSLYFIAATFMLPISISNIGLVVFLLSSIINFIVKGFNNNRFKSINSLIPITCLTIVFSLYLFYLPKADDFNSAFSIIEGKLLLILLPIVLYFTKIPRDVFMKILKVFVFSTSAITLILILNSAIHLYRFHSLLYFQNFTDILNFHAIYASYIIFSALIISLSFLFNPLFFSIQPQHKKFTLSCVFILSIGLVLCASKNVLLSSLLILLISFVKLKLSLKIKAITLILTVSLISIFSITNSSLKSRLYEITQLSGLEHVLSDKKLTNNEMREINGTTLRLLLTKFGYNILKQKESFIFGVSPFSSKKLLLDQYDKKGMKEWYGGYEFHNQYLTYFVEFGLFGLTVYLISLISFLKIFIKNKAPYAIIILLGFMLFQFSETILIRYKGQMLFLFLIPLFLNILTFERENSNNRD